MTILGEGKDLVLECNFCGEEVDRFKKCSIPPHLFKKSHRLICDECSKKLGFYNITQRKIISRALELLWDHHSMTVSNNKNYLSKEVIEDMSSDMQEMREIIGDIRKEITARSVEKK